MKRAFIIAVAVLLVGCGASATRAQARGAVLVTAEAVKLADTTCAQVALERTDLALARACEQAYDLARASAIAAAAAVDAWDEGKRGEVACALQRAAGELRKVASELRARQANVPKVIDDALGLAAGVGGCP